MHCECLLDSEGVTPNPWSGDSNFGGGVLVIGTVLQPPKPKYPSSACHIDTTPAQSDTVILITDAMTSCCEPWRQLEHLAGQGEAHGSSGWSPIAAVGFVGSGDTTSP